MAAVERLYSAKLFRSTNYTVRIVSFSHSYSLPSLVFITPMSTVDQTRHLQELSDVDEKPYLFTKPGGDVTHAARTTSGFTRVGWMTVTGSWMIMFSTFGYLYAFGVYQDYYTRVFLLNHSPSTIAWIGSFQLAMPFFCGIAAGKLYDAGYFHTMEVFGSALFVFSIFMLSLAKPLHYYQIFLSQGVGMGIGAGFTFTPTLSNISHQFYEIKALAGGIILSGTSAGALVFPIMLNHLIPPIGFGKAVRASAYIVLGFLVMGNCLIRRSARNVSSTDAAPLDIKSFFVDPPYILFIFGVLIALTGLYLPLIYIQLYAIEHGIDPTLAFYSIAIINGVSGIGRVAVNFFADVYGPFNVLIPVTVIAGACVFLLLAVHNAVSLVVISVFYGFFSGAWLSVALACLGALSRSPAEVGARTGLTLAIASFGLLGSAPIQGALLGSDFIWWKPAIFSGTLMLVSAAVDVTIRQVLIREKGTHKV
ncbi:hypothetical protein D9619_007550 [Psilocybe cf. subviscida]|uniref:Major facilitator superfamily (MFS) profile domain-containing protein n=1 Tax=Psilocybe cf. subviscida TaxID=2480587 RepID=A0A8H5B1E0_9AGAR|nr:hypothetical protein D9619_007550 [Psilocybe cf. subviscida]